MEYSGTVNNYKKKNNLRHNKNNSMSNHINMSYNYNLRLIPKNKPINNFDPKAFKKSKNSNILSIPLNNGEPIKIKNKENLNNSINKILKKPRTPDLPQQYDNNKINNHQNHNQNSYYKRDVYNGNNGYFKRPSTAPQKGKNLKDMRNYSYDNRKKNMNIYNNHNFNKEQVYNLYYNKSKKRMPSPMIKHQKAIINQNQMQPARYRAPSPIISVSFGLNNFLKKKNI